VRVAASVFGLVTLVLVIVCFGTLGGGFYPTDFWAAGEPRGEGVLVKEMGYARWDFSGLSDVGHQLVLQVALWAEGDREALPVCLRLATPGLGDWRLYRLELPRVGRGEFGWLYFGQLCVSRRDLALGSSLSVRLDPALPDVTMWVDRRSVALLSSGDPGVAVIAGIAGVEEREYSGWFIPAAPRPSSAPMEIDPTIPLPIPSRELPETERFREAVYLAPGTYRGEIGWPGPGVDSSDWYKVNLRPGQTLRVSLSVADGGSCGLAIYDAWGERVASVRAGGQLALEYRVRERGPWYIQISCSKLGQVVSYLLELKIET